MAVRPAADYGKHEPASLFFLASIMRLGSATSFGMDCLTVAQGTAAAALDGEQKRRFMKQRGMRDERDLPEEKT
jgi:hypothetical protein